MSETKPRLAVVTRLVTNPPIPLHRPLPALPPIEHLAPMAPVTSVNRKTPLSFHPDTDLDGTRTESDRREIDDHDEDQHDADQYGTDQHGTDQHGTDQQAADRRLTERRTSDRRQADRRGTDRRVSDRRVVDRDYPFPDRRGGDRRLSDRRIGDRRISERRYADRRMADGDGASGAASPAASTRAETSAPLWTKRYGRLLRTTDVLIVAIAVATAFLIRFAAEIPNLTFSALLGEYTLISALIAITWVLVLGAAHTRDPRIVGLGITEYRRVLNASALTFGLLAIILLVLKVDIARGFFIVTLPLGTIGLIGNRWLWRKWLNRQRFAGRFLSRALVIGEAIDIEYVVGQIESKPWTAYEVVGVAVQRSHATRVQSELEGVTIIPSLDSIATSAAALKADTVIVAGRPAGGSKYLQRLGWELEGTSIELVVASWLTNVAGPRIHFRPVEGLPLMHVELPQFKGGKHIMKRALDIVVSALALIALAPLLLLIAAAIKLDSAGPALFRQERVGRNGQNFLMWKFRSMITDAEAALPGLLEQNEGAGVLFKLRDDPRVTRLGRILRRYSLDELPQLWNILMGDMSLVGPRPPLPREVLSYESHVRRRLYIKPGLTGMWQVNGRSDLSWEESVQLDLYYVENWSLAGDLVLLWRTLKIVFKPVGSY